MRLRMGRWMLCSPDPQEEPGKERTLRIFNSTLLVLPLVVFALLQGCYSGYAVKSEDLSKIQSGVEDRAAVLATVGGGEVIVTEGTAIQVVDHDGLSYKLQPYTFKTTASQLVAPEQDLVLPLGTIDRVEVRKLNALGTVGLFALGVAAGAAIVIGIVATAGEDTGF